MPLFEIIISPFQTFRCMAFCRNLKMVHVDGNEHLVTCKTCEKKRKQGVKNELLTILYFNRGWLTLPLMIPIMVGGALHQFVTGRQGSFEHPPEHSSSGWQTNLVEELRAYQETQSHTLREQVK